MTLPLSRAPFIPGGPLYRLYLGDGDQADVGRVRALFDHDPDQPVTAAARRAAAVDREYRGDRARLVAALREENLRLGSGPAVLAAIERLRDPRAVAVVTGQQAGLFTGPLYALLKAAGAVAVARRLEAELGRPVVPVFWAATEDHDLLEADHAWLLDRNETWRRIRYVPAQNRPGVPVGAIALEAQRVAAVIQELAAVLPAGPIAGDVLALVTATGQAATSLGDWSARLVAALCGPLGLPVLDPMRPALRGLAAPMVQRLLLRHREVAAGLEGGAERVRALGFAPQLATAPGEANLFFWPDGSGGPRRPLAFDDERRTFVLRGEDLPIGTADQLAAMAAGEPARFGGNAATRPILQDEILPTVAYLAGPGEVAYYAMLGDCYRAVGRSMPLIWPRPSVTFLRPAIARLLGKHGLDLATLGDLPAGVRAARQAVVRAADGIGIDALFASATEQIATVYSRVEPALAAYDDVLGSLAGQNHARVRRELEWLQRKAWQVARQRSSEQLAQLARIENSLWPHGGPQERTACGLGLAAELGLDLAAGLAQIDPGPPYCHYYALLG